MAHKEIRWRELQTGFICLGIGAIGEPLWIVSGKMQRV